MAQSFAQRSCKFLTLQKQMQRNKSLSERQVEVETSRQECGNGIAWWHVAYQVLGVSLGMYLCLSMWGTHIHLLPTHTQNTYSRSISAACGCCSFLDLSTSMKRSLRSPSASARLSAFTVWWIMGRFFSSRSASYTRPKKAFVEFRLIWFSCKQLEVSFKILFDLMLKRLSRC